MGDNKPVAISIISYICLKTNLKGNNIFNVYSYGSDVYGTSHEKSDVDIVCIADQIPSIGNSLIDKEANINVTFYTTKDFQKAIDNQEITALECLFLPPQFIHKQVYEFKYTKNLGALRTFISTITSNSWVKGKKKITVMGDYDLAAGIKSVFHSLRILDFGIQIAVNDKIVDYSNMNYILKDIWKLSETTNYDTLWEKINTKYLGLYKQLKNEFKTLCPKENTDHFKEQENLRNIFSKYKIQHPQLTQIIKEILNEVK